MKILNFFKNFNAKAFYHKKFSKKGFYRVKCEFIALSYKRKPKFRPLKQFNKGETPSKKQAHFICTAKF